MLKCIFLTALFFGKLLATPLDDYILAKDDHYQWTLEKKDAQVHADIFWISLTSQQWQTAAEVDQPLWKHRLVIAVPKQRSSKTAILTIGGSALLPSSTPACLELALSTQAVACEISSVPNQPLKFSAEKDRRYLESGRKEDALVAYTWDRYLSTEDATWPLQLPMTKSVVRAMDAISELLQRQDIQTDGFILTGISKRGWIAWTAAAVDSRVKAIVPLVMDALNLKLAYVRHYSAYGNWSLAIKDYVDMQMEKKMHTLPFDHLMQMIDPMAYRERLSLPKYIINASGDEFFLPDSSQLYFADLPGENRLLYLPNTGHHIALETYKETLLAYLHMLLQNRPIPKASWKLAPGNILTVRPDQKPLHITLWQAHNPERRDFSIHAQSWQATPLLETADHIYSTPLALPKRGWSAYYVEMQFPLPSGALFRMSTDIFVLPNTLPFAGGQHAD